MIKLQTSLIWRGCAQGKYIVKAKGYILAVLRWGDKEGPLNDWGPFAYVPIDPAGNGCFTFSGRRGIPREATHVWGRCFASDFSCFEDAVTEIPVAHLPESNQPQERISFSILTDLHLTSKPWKIKQALIATDNPVVFLLGDSTNDGLETQFEKFKNCIAENIPQKSIFPVPGNHDILHPSRSGNTAGCSNYARFQRHLLAQAEKQGYYISYSSVDQSYSVRMEDVDIIGLQCVTTGRNFLFPHGAAIDWLEKHLETTPAAWHIILCHAPMLTHNPNRNDGPPYLDQNKRIQEILDRNGRIIFLSGHTHVSPNVLVGNGEYDEEHRNIYLDCGSVVSTDTSGENGMMSPNWKDGCKTELTITEDTVEICMSSIESGIKFPRGYYRFHVPE